MSRAAPGTCGRAGSAILLIGALHVGFGLMFTPNLAFAENTAIKPESKGGGWLKRHEEMNRRLAQGKVDLIFVGDSITQSWGSEGKGREVWDEYYADRNAISLGISGDRTQHVLWRLENSNFQNVSPKLVVLMIGTNNLPPRNTPKETAEGVIKVVETLRGRLPKAKILLMSICRAHDPNDPGRKAAEQVNRAIQKLNDGKSVFYVDLAKEFMQQDGSIPTDILRDGVHPTQTGYSIWAKTIEPYVKEYVGKGKSPQKG